MTIHVALLGLGTVGLGVYQTIQTHQREFRDLLGTDIIVEAVLVSDEKKKRNIDSNVLVTTHFNDILSKKHIDVVVEAIVGREPAFHYVKKALNQKIPVITANKEMFAYKGQQLKEIANYNNVEILYEASVAGGIPIIGVLSTLLHANRIVKIEGILNGTSNFILTTMRETGCTFDEALKFSQDKGYAEADPSNDIFGTDAFYKLMILSDLVYGEQPDWKKVTCQGIDKITLADLQKAEEQSQRIKLIGRIEKRKDGGLIASVEPISVDHEHPLYSVEGVDNAINVTSDLLGDLLLKGPGAGAFPTASAILGDLTLLFQKKTINRQLELAYQQAQQQI